MPDVVPASVVGRGEVVADPAADGFADADVQAVARQAIATAPHSTARTLEALPIPAPRIGFPVPLGPGTGNQHPHSISLAATVAPSSQQASRSAFDGSPVTATGRNTRSQPIPPVIASIARRAPTVSLFP